MATGRPFFQSSTADLQAIVADPAADRATLLKVLDELGHRERPQAQALKKKLEGILAAHGRAPSAVPLDDVGRPNALDPREDLFATVLADTPHGHELTAELDEPDPELDGVPEPRMTFVQAQGVTGRPPAFRPTLENDVVLEIQESDSMVKKLRIALSAWIAELKRKRTGTQNFSLEDGQKVGVESDGFCYQFDFTEEANLFEGARVGLAIDGRESNGFITAVFQGRILVTVLEDLGPKIRLCILKVDNTALVQALCDRLERIEKGEAPDFRADFAERVLTNRCDLQLPADLPAEKLCKLNGEQRQFVRTAASNEIVWLWGPPGTGKTEALGVLINLLYEEGRRILICSNTNQAVDQVLLKLCTKLEKRFPQALGDGHVLRLGKMEHDELKQYEATITIDGIVAIKSKNLLARKVEVESELLRLGHHVSNAEGILKQFQQLDQATSSWSAERSELGRVEQDLIQRQSHAEAQLQAQERFRAELARWQTAGTLRRLFLRQQGQINRDLTGASAGLAAANRAVQEGIAVREVCKQRLGHSARRVAELNHMLAAQDRQVSQAMVDECNKMRQPLRAELAQIDADLEALKDAVVRDARVVGATVTRATLRPDEFTDFDTVIIDEASMILLPAIFHAAGLAKKSVVIGGDFLQLPPIVPTSQQQIHGLLSRDIFDVSGVTDKVRAATSPANLTKLCMQYRMDKEICRYVSKWFYEDFGNPLETAVTETEPSVWPEWLDKKTVIIDTSSVQPFTTRNTFGSRFNVMHALVVRNAVLHLQGFRRRCGAGDVRQVGICTPYSAQAKLHQKIMTANKLEKLVRARTAHGFQGDECNLIILDLVDSIGERYAGVFLQAEDWREQGAKLLNVAISRAKEGLVIVANLAFLDAKLPSKAKLRGILHEMQSQGRVIDAKDILALCPVLTDLRRFGGDAALDPETQRTGLVRGKDFEFIARRDMAAAEKAIVIFSGFITVERVAALGDLLRERIARGVKVRCVTRPPSRNGTIPEAQGREAIDALEQIGAVVDLRGDIHEKAVVIDGKVAWFGSLNPLSHTSRTSEIMARVEDPGFAENLADFLSSRRGSADASDPHRTNAENPRCDCGGRTILMTGKFGLFYACEDCGATSNPGSQRPRSEPTATRGKGAKAQAPKAAGKCPKCGAPRVARVGRFGEFFSCSNYPKCDGKVAKQSTAKRKQKPTKPRSSARS